MLFPLDADRLHLDLDEVVVGYLVDGVSYDGVEDGEVPNTQLVQLVAFPVSGCLLSKGRGEPGLPQVGVQFVELPVEVPS